MPASAIALACFAKSGMPSAAFEALHVALDGEHDHRRVDLEQRRAVSR
jgi:hypothetical protein